MTTRAKFVCNSIEDYGWSKKVKLSAVYAPAESSEDGGFTKATPSGELWMTIDNPNASVQFVPGKKYYLDITEAPEA